VLTDKSLEHSEPNLLRRPSHLRLRQARLALRHVGLVLYDQQLLFEKRPVPREHRTVASHDLGDACRSRCRSAAVIHGLISLRMQASTGTPVVPVSSDAPQPSESRFKLPGFASPCPSQYMGFNVDSSCELAVGTVAGSPVNGL